MRHCLSSVVRIFALGVVALPSVVTAAPTVINGSGSGTGINAGFGDFVGAGSTLSLAGDATGVNFVLDTAANRRLDGANAVVVYLDTDNGASGFADTTAFTDIGDPAAPDSLRQATSGFNGTTRSAITFAPGFNADFAVAFQGGFGVLFRLGVPSQEFISVIGTGDAFGAGGTYAFSTPFDDLSLTASDSFRYVATYLNPADAFRSDEFQGVARSTVPPGNVGFGSVTLAAGDFNTFNSVPEPASLALVGLAGVLGLARRRR